MASQNLGEGAGLLAAAALMIDYILTASVGISAGVGALISAVPSLQPHTLELCLAALAILTIVNMRGVHDTGVVFMIPTYLFTGTLLIVIAVGGWQTLHAAGHPHPVTTHARDSHGDHGGGRLVAAVEGLFFRLHGYDRVEAVSNGVMAFREPTRKNAKATLTIIIALLAILLLGIALLCRAYGIAATNPNGPGYESVLSMLTRAVMGHGWFYLRHHRFSAAGARALGQHRICRFSAPHARHRTRWLHAAYFSHPRPAAALFLGHLCAGGAHGAAADRVRRRHRPADSALRHRRLHGFHAVAGGDGDALEAPARHDPSAGAPEAKRQRV